MQHAGNAKIPHAPKTDKAELLSDTINDLVQTYALVDA